MHLAYACHDAFPSSDANTQQIFWTVFEVARLGVAVDLYVPWCATPNGQDPSVAIAEYYGADPAALPSTFRIVPLDPQPPSGASARGWFDWQVPVRVPAEPRLIWTRDALTVLSCVRAGRPVVFETYRTDFASAARYAPWRAGALGPSGARAVITHSYLTARAFIAAGVPQPRCLVAHNGFAPALMSPVLDRREAREMTRLSGDRPVVVYAGHIGPHKGTDALLHLAATVPEIRFVILGGAAGSGEVASLEQRAASLGVDNVVFRPEVPPAQVAPYLYAADCLVIPPTGAPLQRFGRTIVPLKMFSYLAAGRPILAAKLPDIEEVLTDGQDARLVPPDGPREAGEALRDLLADPDLQLVLSRGALARATAFTWEARARKIVDFLGSVA